MTQQPFDPMDKLLREALASDALPPADLTDRIMARVAETPRQRSAPAGKHTLKWVAAAAACLVIVGAALPTVLHSQSAPQDAASNDCAAPPDTNYYASTAPTEGDPDGLNTADTDKAVESRKEQSLMTGGADALSAALSDADEVLYYQGYSLDVIARTENAVQAGLVDSNGDPVDNGAILDNAMTAAGFTYADGWYILTSEDTAP